MRAAVTSREHSGTTPAYHRSNSAPNFTPNRFPRAVVGFFSQTYAAQKSLLASAMICVMSASLIGHWSQAPFGWPSVPMASSPRGSRFFPQSVSACAALQALVGRVWRAMLLGALFTRRSGHERLHPDLIVHAGRSSWALGKLVLADGCLLSPLEVGTVEPHAVHDDSELAG
jgi:hypothetical protein